MEEDETRNHASAELLSPHLRPLELDLEFREKLLQEALLMWFSYPTTN
jgi:hypothetical protein